MKTTIAGHVLHFLEAHCKGAHPLLLGFSGGPDSLALLHILMNWRREYPLNLHLAHVDHGWRAESAQEAQILKAKAQEWGLPFHLRTLSPKEMTGNLEAESRKRRYAFFAEIYRQENCQALLLGHHAQDQVETVLKRILEGMSLPFLSGMAERRELMGMEVWRPLLKIPKEAIEAYIQAHALQPFYDPTNNDPHYLRGRMRTEMLPSLSAQFGKEVKPAICRISEEAYELKQFLDCHLAAYIARIAVSPYGSLLDLSASYPETLLERKYLLRKLAETQNVSVPHALIDKACELIPRKSAGRHLACKGVRMEIDRGRVFLYTRPMPQIEVQQSQGTGILQPSSWKEAWRGEGHVQLPAGEYHLGPPRLDARCLAGPTLGKWWTDHKVPVFLRNLIPVIYHHDVVAHEFLTGRLQTPHLTQQLCFRLGSVNTDPRTLSVCPFWETN